MKEFQVTIRETLEMQVNIEADSAEEALESAKRNWKNGDYILDAECFSDVDFVVAPRSEKRGERSKKTDEKDLISRQMALAILDDTDGFVFYRGDVMERIRKIPSIEVEPVRHGRWIEEDGYQICSNCGEEHHWGEYRATYCEDCGTKMDLEGCND